MARDVASPATDEGPGARKHGVLSFFKELPVLIALALGIALLVKALLVQAFFIPSASMEPTLLIGDRVLVSKLSYRIGDPDRGDVVVFKDPYEEQRCPKNPPPGVAQPEECSKGVLRKAYEWFAELFGLPTGETKDYIKRVAALPGETVEMRDGDVYIDGKKIDFPHTAREGPQKDSVNVAPYRVPEGEYYVLGDNRGNSSDSRIFKSISRKKIVGKAFVLLWPPNRFSGL